MSASAAVRVLIPPTLAELPPIPALDAGVWSLAGTTMGTHWRVRLVPAAFADRQQIEGAIQNVLDRLVLQMSTWLPQSELCRFNAAPADTPVLLSAEFAAVLTAALQVASDSGGAYDPTTAPLVDLWGFGPAPRSQAMPADAAISAARAAVGWQRLHFDSSSRCAIQPGGLRLDLSAIAKGYAVDRVCAVLRTHGVEHFLVEVGGELRGQGCKPDGLPWWVELERTLEETCAPLRVALHGLAVASSGDALQHFTAGGRRYSHTIDPRSGWPVADALAGVTVLHCECMWADALATAIYVLGADAGFKYACERALAVRLLLRTDDGLHERMTPAFVAMLD